MKGVFTFLFAIAIAGLPAFLYGGTASASAAPGVGIVFVEDFGDEVVSTAFAEAAAHFEVATSRAGDGVGHSSPDGGKARGDSLGSDPRSNLRLESPGQLQAGSSCPPAGNPPRDEDVSGDGTGDWKDSSESLGGGYVREVWCVASGTLGFFMERIIAPTEHEDWTATCKWDEGMNWGAVRSGAGGTPERLSWINLEDDTNNDGTRTDDNENGKADILFFSYDVAARRLLVSIWEISEAAYQQVTMKVDDAKTIDWGKLIDKMLEDDTPDVKVVNRPKQISDVRNAASELAQGGGGGDGVVAQSGEQCCGCVLDQESVVDDAALGDLIARVTSIGGFAELPAVDAAPLEAIDSSGTSPGVWAAIIGAAALAGSVSLGGAAWYVRRRRDA